MNVFDAAAVYLQENGWQKGQRGGNGGPACLIGALGSVDPERHVGQYFSEIREAIEEQYPDRCCGWGIAAFNDNPATRLEDVLVVLDKAGRKLEERV